MFKLPPSEVRAEIISDIEVGLVPFVQSSPGIGKSAIVKQIARDFDLELIDLRLSQCAPEDLMGLPMRVEINGVQKSVFTPFNTFPLVSDPLPKDKNGWILFLDEFNSATKLVQAAAYKVALDKMVGQERIHENCFVVCAGNLSTDRAITTELSTAMQSRLMHYEMELNFSELMEHAVKEDWDYRVMGFLNYQPSKLYTFKPDHTDKTFACPRTWDFLQRKIKGKATQQLTIAGMAAAVSDGVAVEFHTFLEEFDDLPTYRQIVTDPRTCKVPEKASTCFALTAMIHSRFQEQDMEDLVIYIKRLSAEFQVIFFRGLVQRFPKIRDNRFFAPNILHLTEFLKDIQRPVAA